MYRSVNLIRILTRSVLFSSQDKLPTVQFSVDNETALWSLVWRMRWAEPEPGEGLTGGPISFGLFPHRFTVKHGDSSGYFGFCSPLVATAGAAAAALWLADRRTPRANVPASPPTNRRRNSYLIHRADFSSVRETECVTVLPAGQT